MVARAASLLIGLLLGGRMVSRAAALLVGLLLRDPWWLPGKRDLFCLAVVAKRPRVGGAACLVL